MVLEGIAAEVLIYIQGHGVTPHSEIQTKFFSENLKEMVEVIDKLKMSEFIYEVVPRRMICYYDITENGKNAVAQITGYSV